MSYMSKTRLGTNGTYQTSQINLAWHSFLKRKQSNLWKHFTQYSNFISVTTQFSRWYTYHNHLVHMRSKGDNSSQREIIMSPSEHSSVTYPNLLLPPNVTTTNGGCGISGTAAQCQFFKKFHSSFLQFCIRYGIYGSFFLSLLFSCSQIFMKKSSNDTFFGSKRGIW